MPFWYSFKLNFWYSSDTLQMRMPFWYSFRFNFWYSSDTLQTRMPFWYSFRLNFWYSSDTLQTRIPFWYSFRLNFQIQFRYAPYTDAILILIQSQLSDTVQIRSRRGCCSITHSDSTQIQFRYALDTDAILILIQTQLSDTVQICSRHGCHSDTHSDSTFRYSSNTLQTRMPFWYPLRFNFQIQYKYAPDTDAILILILSAYKLQFNNHSWMAYASPSPTILRRIQNGIFKPISGNLPLPTSKWHL